MGVPVPKTITFRRRGRKVLSDVLGGGVFQLEGWDYIHETFNDYPDSPNEGITGEELNKAVGWTGPATVIEAAWVVPLTKDTTDTGYTHNTSIDGVGGGEGWVGNWTVG